MFNEMKIVEQVLKVAIKESRLSHEKNFLILSLTFEFLQFSIKKKYSFIHYSM